MGLITSRTRSDAGAEPVSPVGCCLPSSLATNHGRSTGRSAGPRVCAGAMPRGGFNTTVTSCRPTSWSMRSARVAIPAVLTSMTEALGASRTMISSSCAQPASGKM